MGDKRFGSVILASALFAWGCGSTGSGGTAGTSGGTAGASGTTGSGGSNPQGTAGTRRGTGGSSTPGTGGGTAGTGGGSTAGTGGSTTGTGGSGTPGTGGSSGGATGRRPRAAAARRVAAAPRAPAVEAAPRARAAERRHRQHRGHGRQRTGGSGTGVTVKLDATHQTIEGFGINTALSSADSRIGTSSSPPRQRAWAVHRSHRHEFERQPIGSYPAEPATTRRSSGRPGARPRTARATTARRRVGHLLESCYDSWSTTIANFAQHKGSTPCGSRTSPTSRRAQPPWTTLHRDYDTTILHRQTRWWPGSRCWDRRSRPRGSRSSRPNRRNGSTPGAMLRPRARLLPAIRTARIR